MAAVAAPFDRDMEADFQRVGGLVSAARSRGVRLLALPEACLGGYLADLRGQADAPPALRADGPEIARLAALAGEMVVCAGFCEDAGGTRYNSVVCVSGDGVLGVHRKVHQPLREDASYAAGDAFAAFDTPVGRLGMMICYDKAFPESARSLALDGRTDAYPGLVAARGLACPASRRPPPTSVAISTTVSAGSAKSSVTHGRPGRRCSSSRTPRSVATWPTCATPTPRRSPRR